MSVLDKRRILQGSASNLTRVILGMLISLVLPHFLVQHLGTAEYSAWVLILQLSAYVNFLDLGLQTAIGKFVAEYSAAGNSIAARKTVSTAFTVMLGAAIIGALAIFGMVWQVPRLFTQMPGALVGDVRCGLIAVGMSVAFALPFGVFLATFTGLQEYGFPTVLIAASRIVSTVGLIALLLMHGTLVQMALLMAVCNIATALLQFVGWKRYASSRIGFELFGFDKATSSRLLEYCGVLTIWTIGSLLISGLDTAIVGHFDYQNTGYYAIASSATNFMLLLVSNLLGPLLPAISSLQVDRTPRELGERTRYRDSPFDGVAFHARHPAPVSRLPTVTNLGRRGLRITRARLFGGAGRRQYRAPACVSIRAHGGGPGSAKIRHGVAGLGSRRQSRHEHSVGAALWRHRRCHRHADWRLRRRPCARRGQHASHPGCRRCRTAAAPTQRRCAATAQLSSASGMPALLAKICHAAASCSFVSPVGCSHCLHPLVVRPGAP